MKRKLPDTLPAPERNSNIPVTAYWLAGEGAGSWFSITHEPSDDFTISRFAPNGTLECSGVFLASEELMLELPFTFDFPSNCKKVTIVQNHHRIMLRLKDESI